MRFPALYPLALLSLSNAALAQDRGPSTYVFADVPWGASRQTTMQAYEALRLTLDHFTSDSQLVFGGRLFELPISILAQFIGDSLGKVTIRFADSVAPFSLYERLASQLSSKYGAPANLDSRAFMAGMEDAGVRLSTWPLRAADQPKPKRLTIKQFERIELVAIRGQGTRIEYTSANWEAHAQARDSLDATPF